jgi:hypothetical protein
MYEGGWNLDLRRRLSKEDMAEWEELRIAVEQIELNCEEDVLHWALEPSGKSSTKSLYKLMANKGVTDHIMTELWSVKLPLKINIFLWVLWHDRVQTGEQLKKRNGKGSENCKYCGKLETREHLFFNCTVAQIIWV